MLKSRISISIIITCYCEGYLVKEAVDSALKQAIQPLEIIIVNDASICAKTIEVCQLLENNPLVRVIWRHQNGGPSIARNDGFLTAQGDILVPLDADDLLPENALSNIYQTFLDHPEIDFVHGSYLKQTERSDPGSLIHPEDISLQTMLKAKSFSLSSQWNLIGTAPLRKSLWEKMGRCDPTLGADDLHDLEFWLRAIASGCQYCYIPEVIYIWRKYLGRNSRRVTPLSWYRIVQRHFDIYQRVGLEYRAYELLLLGSKWLNDSEETQRYSKSLLQCIFRGRFQFSSLVALGLPAPLLQLLVKRVGRNR